MTYEETVNDFLRKGLINKQKTGFDQVEKLVMRAQKDLKVARTNMAIDEEVAYQYAYLAMMRCGRALILLQGIRPTDGQQHKTVIELSRLILGDDFETLIVKFDQMRRKRNQFTYEPSSPVSASEAKNALSSAGDFVKKVSVFIKKQNSQQHFSF